MPITFTFDIEEDSIDDKNDRARITACFRRLGWESLGGSAWRYPELGGGGEHASEDWFNHVIPALMYFRSLVEHSRMRVTQFTLDAHSEAGYRQNTNAGAQIQNGDQITMYPYESGALSENRLKSFIRVTAESLE
ncbi:hypothetical protein ACLBWZ_16330 [Brucellaceae bacterium C25G]